MPQFFTHHEPIEFNVEVEEFVDECSEREIKELIAYLHLSGYLTDAQLLGTSQTIMEDDFRRHLGILFTNYRRLSEEELFRIQTMAKKY
jgi:DNA-binding ferritin-like protein